MIRIAVVDDEPLIIDMISEKVSDILNKHKINYEVLTFTDGKSLIKSFEWHRFNLIILDIDMHDITGIDVAKKIRSYSESTTIIFVTNKDEMVYEAIKFVPYRFIRKTKFEAEIHEAIESFLEKNARKKEVLIFSTENGKKTLPVSNVIFIEVDSHKLTIHMKSGMLEANGTLKDIELQGRDYGFIRIHQSYLVNFRFITVINHKGVNLDSGELLPLGKGKYENVKMELMRFSRELEL